MGVSGREDKEWGRALPEVNKESHVADTCRDKEVSFTNGQETLNAGTVLRYLNSVQSSEPHQLCTLALVPLK